MKIRGQYSYHREGQYRAFAESEGCSYQIK